MNMKEHRTLLITGLNQGLMSNIDDICQKRETSIQMAYWPWAECRCHVFQVVTLLFPCTLKHDRQLRKNNAQRNFNGTCSLFNRATSNTRNRLEVHYRPMEWWLTASVPQRDVCGATLGKPKVDRHMKRIPKDILLMLVLIGIGLRFIKKETWQKIK